MNKTYKDIRQEVYEDILVMRGLTLEEACKVVMA